MFWNDIIFDICIRTFFFSIIIPFPPFFFSIIIPFSPLFFSEKLILECIIEQIARHQFKRWMNCKRALMVGKGKILASVVMILSWVIFSLPFSFYKCFCSLTWSVLYLFNLAFYFLNEVFELHIYLSYSWTTRSY